MTRVRFIIKGDLIDLGTGVGCADHVEEAGDEVEGGDVRGRVGCYAYAAGFGGVGWWDVIRDPRGDLEFWVIRPNGEMSGLILWVSLDENAQRKSIQGCMDR